MSNTHTSKKADDILEAIRNRQKDFKQQPDPGNPMEGTGWNFYYDIEKQWDLRYYPLYNIIQEAVLHGISMTCPKDKPYNEIQEQAEAMALCNASHMMEEVGQRLKDKDKDYERMYYAKMEKYEN